MLRERNERGFSIFLQNLKSVLNLLASADELETDVLIQTRSQLVDASGTLSFLLNDMSNGCTDVTGIPSNGIQLPMQHLKNSLTYIIDLLSSRIECRNNVDFCDSLDISYSVPIDLSQTGRGRKRYEITKDQLEHLRSLYFSWEVIARILRVSLSTLQRRRYNALAQLGPQKQN